MKRRTHLLVGIGLISVISGSAGADIRALSPNELMDIRAGNCPTGHCTNAGVCGKPSVSGVGSKPCSSAAHSTTYKTIHWTKHWYSSGKNTLSTYKTPNGYKCNNTKKTFGKVVTVPDSAYYTCKHGVSGPGCSTPAAAPTCQIQYSWICQSKPLFSFTAAHGGILITYWGCQPQKTNPKVISVHSTCE
jgi:hypothetical protein